MSNPVEQLRLIKYTLLQSTIGPSIACDLFVFAYLIRQWRKEILNAPQNHVVIALLIVSFLQKITDMPVTLYLLRWGVVFQQTDTFCLIWNWIDYSALAGSLHLVAWCSIERHLFVFHSQLMKKKWSLICFHYFPIFICLSYAPLFYVGAVFISVMCTNAWDFASMYCGGACYSYTQFWGGFDWSFHYGTPVLVVVVANLLLFHRFIRQKTRHRQAMQWRHQKRMIIQLAFISLLYLILLSPEIILGLIEALWLPTFGVDVEVNYFYYVGIFINQLLPFVIVGSLPGTRHELMRWCVCVRRCFPRLTQIQPALPVTTVPS